MSPRKATLTTWKTREENHRATERSRVRFRVGPERPISTFHVLDEAEIRKRPVYIAMVDVSGSEEFLELVKSSLLAALEALSPAALFGLVTFGSKVGLYDLQGPTASLKSVAIPASPSHRLPLALGDLLPLQAFLASVAHHKDHIAAALETLRPAPPSLDLDASGGVKGGKDAGRGEAGRRRDGVRGFGTALDALIRYLGGMEDGPSARLARGLRADIISGGAGGNVSIAAAAAAAAAAGAVGPFVGARLLVFLSGAPNHGMGALSTDRYETALASLAVAANQRSRSGKEVLDPIVADKGLLQEQTPFYRELAAAAVQAGVCVDLFAVPSYASNGDEEAHRGDGGAATADAAAAAAAAAAGAAISAVTISDPPSSTPPYLPTPYCDLASLRCLSVESGGTLFLYPSLDEATLPQDIYRMLCRPSAFGGVLRLRTSRELRAVRAYGHFFPDAQYEDLYHIIRCDPFDSYAFDLEFAGKKGFGQQAGGSLGRGRGVYTVIIPVDGGGERSEENSGGGVGVGSGSASKGDGAAASGQNGVAGLGMEGGKGKEGGREMGGEGAVAAVGGGEGGGGGGKGGRRRRRVVLRRRLRVKTICVEVAKGAREIYESADNEAILTVLTHKVIRASLEEGVREGRLLLQDWLVILTAHYNHAFGLAQFNQPHSVTRLDVSFSACPQLQPLPRLAFALLRSPLLQLPREGVHPDLRTFLHCLYSSLDPSFLMRAVYPVLSSYTTPDRPAFPRHSLSRAALVTSGSPIFLLDAFSTIIVFYSPVAPPDLPFPPPQTSLLRATINRLKADRIITPRTITIRGGIDSTAPFETFLIEEQDVDGDVEGGAVGMGFVAFLESIARDVREYMK
ncbi:hypothetical protein CLOM_g8679 [Closterium sp. NIES-68]|nr:hypothetical protein CLOM_g8679 [Closterium sp. NIES-68]